MVFLFPYALFDVPSNYLLKKLRPSVSSFTREKLVATFEFLPQRWIAFLVFSCGILTIGISGTKSYAAVSVVRFLLGTFEAGAVKCTVHPEFPSADCLPIRVLPGPGVLLELLVPVCVPDPHIPLTETFRNSLSCVC
jgi:hypothetical protein